MSEGVGHGAFKGEPPDPLPPVDARAVPQQWLVAGGTWPGGGFRGGTPWGVLAASLVCSAVMLLCSSRQWSLTDLAAEVNVPVEQIEAVLFGRSLPSVEFLAAVRQVAGVTVWPTPEMVALLRARCDQPGD